MNTPEYPSGDLLYGLIETRFVWHRVDPEADSYRSTDSLWKPAWRKTPNRETGYRKRIRLYRANLILINRMLDHHDINDIQDDLGLRLFDDYLAWHHHVEEDQTPYRSYVFTAFMFKHEPDETAFKLRFL